MRNLRQSVLENAGKRQLELEKLALIDVSHEDDNLLLTGETKKAGSPYAVAMDGENFSMAENHCGAPRLRSPGPALEERDAPLSARNLNVINEGNISQGSHLKSGQELPNQHFHQQHCRPAVSQQADIVVAEHREDAVQKKRTKGRTNLRKSLAWNKAFFTEEGVLDVEELQIVSKTPKKPLQLPVIEIPDLPRPSIQAPGAASSPHPGRFSNDEIQQTKSSPKLMGRPSEDVRPLDGHQMNEDFESEASPDAAGTVPEAGKDSPNPSDQVISRPVPVHTVIERAIQKGTRLRLPSSFTKKTHAGKETDDLSKLPPLPSKPRLQRSQSAMVLPSSSNSLSKRVSSMSKKVKDALGRVLPGNLGGPANVKILKESPDKSFGKHPSIGRQEAPSKSTSAYASSPFNRSGRNILPEASSMLTRQQSSSAASNGLSETSAKLTSAKSSSPFNRSGRNILPETSIVSTRQQSRSASNGQLGTTAKLSSGHVSSPFNRSGRIMLPETSGGATRHLSSATGSYGHLEPLAKLSNGHASSPFNRSGRDILTDISAVSTRQHASSSGAVGSPAKASAGQPTGQFIRSGRSVLSEFSNGGAKQSLRSSAKETKTGSGQCTSPLNRSGRNIHPEMPTALSRSSSLKGNFPSHAEGKVNSQDPTWDKSSGTRPSGSATGTGSIKKAAPMEKTEISNQVARNNIETKTGDTSMRTSSGRHDIVRPVQKGDIKASVGGSSSSNPRPSGLRMPAAKLNFFEMTRTNGPATLIMKSDVKDTDARKKVLPRRVPDVGGRSRLPNVSSGRAGLATDSSARPVCVGAQSSIPPAPHLRGINDTVRSRGPSASAPASPQRSNSQIHPSESEQSARRQNIILSSQADDRLCADGLNRSHPEVATDASTFATADGGGHVTAAEVEGQVQGQHVLVNPVASGQVLTLEERNTQPSVGDTTEWSLPVSDAEMDEVDKSEVQKERNDVSGYASGASPMTRQISDAGITACNSNNCVHGDRTTVKECSLEIMPLLPKEVIGQGCSSTSGRPTGNPSHWTDWQKIQERTPDAQKSLLAQAGDARSISPVLASELEVESGPSPTFPSYEDGPRLVRCTSSPTILNGTNPLTNALPKRRESRSFLALARKAVRRLTSSPSTSGKASQEHENANGQSSGGSQKGRRLSRAGHNSQSETQSAEKCGTESSAITGLDPTVAENPQGGTSLDIKKLCPFTEEWIAAVEAAGEEVLEKKGGSVQNSPPNKISPKSNPWSPVRRNGQQLGPFDCTKRCS